jgi:hypothetical protein
MRVGGQQFVEGTKLSAFGADGSFTEVVLTVNGDVAGGGGRSWIMGTAAFQAASGLAPDFVFAPGLPVGGGMICWGLPLQESDPADYVDCVAYGTYTGPGNIHTSSPNPISPEGHSLRRIADGNDSSADFVCSDPAAPENNAGATASMPATTPCDGATTSTTPTSSSTSTTLGGADVCGDGTADESITATDALLALSAAVGTAECALCRCDVDDNGGIAASDALRILSVAVGAPVSLECPAC